jgi:hypothetical protein
VIRRFFHTPGQYDERISCAVGKRFRALRNDVQRASTPLQQGSHDTRTG